MVTEVGPFATFEEAEAKWKQAPVGVAGEITRYNVGDLMDNGQPCSKPGYYFSLNQ